MKKIIPPGAKFSAIVDILSGKKTQSEAALDYGISNGYLSILFSKTLKSIQQIVGIEDEVTEEEVFYPNKQNTNKLNEQQEIRSELNKLEKKLAHLKSKIRMKS
ncbi:MAG: hypothetical protein EOL98_09385 [Negativicutes bacterium]|nr:hypothetical protein [Negativicutes bacterium]